MKRRELKNNNVAQFVLKIIFERFTFFNTYCSKNSFILKIRK
jgi:hypothetical protein